MNYSADRGTNRYFTGTSRLSAVSVFVSTYDEFLENGQRPLHTRLRVSRLPISVY